MVNVLYIHGMGGGGDSRIPSILDDALRESGVRVIARTYDFDPEKAQLQINSWIEELQPSLVMGESLGTLHALRVVGIPHILISPAVNAHIHLGYVFAALSLIPGVSCLLGRIYKPREGDRQRLVFTYEILWKYREHGKEAMKHTVRSGSTDYFYAFIGKRDHYRRTGVVSIRTWKKLFGDTLTVYDGIHFTEEEHIHGLIVPKIMEVLNIK